MSDPKKITLSFKNAKEVLLPKSVADELEGIKLWLYLGYPQGEPIFILSRLVTNDSPAGQAVGGGYLVSKDDLIDILHEKNLTFSKDWIKKNIPGNYIRVTKDCVKDKKR